MAAESIGELGVSITGEYSALSDSITSAVQEASKGAGQIADAFNVPDLTAPMVKSFQDLIEEQQQAQQAFQQAHGVYEAAQIAFDNGSVSAEVLASALTQLQNAADKAGESGHKASGAFSEFGESAKGVLETLTEVAALAGVSVGLGEIAKEAIEAYSAVQLATVSLTALTGSASAATETIEGLKTIAQSDAISFPSLVQAQQRMAAFGFTAEESRGSLQAVADSAAATGNNFDAVANSFGRIVESGTASSRTLVQLGLSMGDLARAMGVSEDQAKKTFAALDQEDRITVLQDALEKFSGVAAAAADTVSGHWTQFQNALDFAFEDVGSIVAPALIQLLDGLQSVIPVATQFVQLFGGPAVQHMTALVGAMGELKDASVALSASLSNLVGLSPHWDLFNKSFESFASDVVNNLTHFRDLTQVLTVMAGAMDVVSGRSASMDEAAKKVAASVTNAARASTEAAIGLDDLAAKAKNAADEHLRAAIAALNTGEAISNASHAFKDERQAIDESAKAMKAFSEASLDDASIAQLEKLQAQLEKARQDVLNTGEANGKLGFTFNALGTDIEVVQARVIALASYLADLDAPLGTSAALTNQQAKAFDAMAKTIGEDVQLALKGYQDQINSRLKLQADDLASVKAYDQFLKSEHIPTFSSLSDALSTINGLRQNQIDAAAKVQTAEAAENALLETHSLDLAANKEATQNAKDARDALALATEQLNAAEVDLQANYGLTKDAIDLMTASQDASTSSAQLQLLAYADLGLKVPGYYKGMADAAARAYDIIKHDAQSSYSDQQNAAIKATQAQIQMYENTGTGSVPAALQIQLANLTQQQKDFVANSQHQWITLFNSIDSSVQNLDKSMISTLFGGKGSFYDEAIKALQDIGASVLTLLVKPFEDAVARLLSGAIANLLGSSGIGGIASGLSQIGKFFGLNTSGLDSLPSIAGTGSQAAIGAINTGQTAAAPITQIGQTISTSFQAITSAITAISSAISAVTGIIGDIEQAHTNTLLSRIEESTRYTAGYIGSQPESVLWSTENTAGNTLAALDHLNMIYEQTALARQDLDYILGQATKTNDLLTSGLKVQGVPTASVPGVPTSGTPATTTSPSVPGATPANSILLEVPASSLTRGQTEAPYRVIQAPTSAPAPTLPPTTANQNTYATGDVSVTVHVHGSRDAQGTAKAIAQMLRSISPKFATSGG